jgi:putative transposase
MITRWPDRSGLNFPVCFITSHRAMIGYAGPLVCLTVDWILAAFGRRRLEAIERYKRFVAAGKGQPALWSQLKGQIFPGRQEFVDEMLSLIATDRELSEVPSSQRRPLPMDLSHYCRQSFDRNSAICEAYSSGGYTLKVLGEFFGLHYSTVSGIIKNHKSKT